MRKRKIASCLLILLFIFSSLATYAQVGDDANNGGGGGTGLSGASGTYTWRNNQTGYRFYVVDKEFNQVSNTVDILYSEPIVDSFGNNFYTGTRCGNLLSNSISNYKHALFSDLIEQGVTSGGTRKQRGGFMMAEVQFIFKIKKAVNDKTSTVFFGLAKRI